MSQGETMLPFGTTGKLMFWSYLVVQKYIRFLMAEAGFVILHELADIDSILPMERSDLL